MKVIWVAAYGVKNPQKPGVGVQFSGANNVAKDEIETFLVGVQGAVGAAATL